MIRLEKLKLFLLDEPAPRGTAFSTVQREIVVDSNHPGTKTCARRVHPHVQAMLVIWALAL